MWQYLQLLDDAHIIRRRAHMLQLIALRTKLFIYKHRAATAKVTNKRFALTAELDGSMQQHTTKMYQR